MIESLRNVNRRSYHPNFLGQEAGTAFEEKHTRIPREKTMLPSESPQEESQRRAGLSEESSGCTPVADPDDLPDARGPYDVEAFHEADSDAAEGEFVILSVYPITLASLILGFLLIL